MPRRNRIDPWGDLHAVSGRGLLTGNRGCLVDDRAGSPVIIVAHSGSPAFSPTRAGSTHSTDPGHGHRFFLDDAVALAAGHRPVASVAEQAYVDYRDAVSAPMDRHVRPVPAT